MEPLDKIEQLYLQYEVLSSGEGEWIEGGPEEKAYHVILSASTGTDKEKTLVAQFIPRFFHRFPKLYEEVITSYLDLCEDPNVSVRKEAIKGFPKFFEGETNSFTKRFADILTQMLVAHDHSEAALVRDTLSALLRSSPGGTLQGIFCQVKTGDEPVRSLALKFLGNRIRKWNSFWSKDILDILLTEVKVTLEDCLPEEIPILLGLLLSTSLGKTLAGRRQILSRILVILNEDKQTLQSGNLRRFAIFLRHATALISISADVNSNEYFLFLTKEVLPHYLSFPGSRVGCGDSLRILKLFAELSFYTKELNDIDDSIERVLSLLLEFLPCPSTNDSSQILKKLEFLTVECLLSSLHRILKASPNYFSKKQETLRDLRYRLLYFAKASGAYKKVIEEAIKIKTKEVEKIKVAAIKTLSNINTIVKDFFHNPPNPCTTITLSWLFLDRSFSSKRKTSHIEYEKSEKIQKMQPEEGLHTYKPPIGKYSQNLKVFRETSQ